MEGAFDKLQHPLVTKPLNKPRIEGNFLNLMKATYKVSIHNS